MLARYLNKIFFIGFAFILLQSCKTNETTSPLPTIKLTPCGDHVKYGYTDKSSYSPGEEMQVFLQSDSSITCGVTIYTINGATAFVSNASLTTQAEPSNSPSENGFNFNLTTNIKIPPTLESGIYSIEKSVRFVVKSTNTNALTVVYPTNTIEAYNSYGGKSLYAYNSTDQTPSPIVSFLRPTDNPEQQVDFCHDCLVWFTTTGLSTNYVADSDLDEIATFEQSNILVIVGHSEYWTRKARINFDAYVNKGGHAIILSGNSMWWQVRYNLKRDELICYRDALLDPNPDPSLKTISWSDPSLQLSVLSSIGADFNHGGYGNQSDHGWDGFKIVNPDSPLLAGLYLQKGDIISLPTVEYDGTPILSFDPEGFPILDNSQLNFEKVELIGFDRGSRSGQETIGTFIAFQKTKTSGIIINTGSTSWCSSNGIGSQNSGNQIKKITLNAILRLFYHRSVFSN